MALGVYTVEVLTGSNASNDTAAAALQTAILGVTTLNGQPPQILAAGMDVNQITTPTFNYWAIVTYQAPNS